MGHKVYIGEKIQTHVRIQNTIQLERYVKDPHNDHGGGCYKACANHNFDKCLYDKISSIMQNKTEDNCTPPWVPNSSKIWKKPTDIDTTFLIDKNRITNQEKDCDVPCHSVVVDVHGKNYRKYYTRNYGELYVYFGFAVTKSTEHYFYTGYRLVAEVGGYVGLFIGYSFFHLVGSIRYGLENIFAKNKKK